MTATVVAHTAKATVPNTTGSTTAAIDTSTATILVLAANYSSTVTPTISDSYANAWTHLTAYDSTNGKTRISYCLNPIVGPGHTFSASGAGTSAAIAVIAANGAAGASAFGIANGAATNSSPSSLGAGIANATADAGIFTFLNVDLAVTPTINIGFTRLDSVNTDGATVYGISSAFLNAGAGSISPTWSWAGGAQCSVAIASFAVKQYVAPSSAPNRAYIHG